MGFHCGSFDFTLSLSPLFPSNGKVITNTILESRFLSYSICLLAQRVNSVRFAIRAFANFPLFV